jgi:DNA polymerase III alpha subunit
MLTETNTQSDLIEGVMRHGPYVLENCLADLDSIKLYTSRIDLERLNYPIPKTEINPENWFIPREYQTYDIVDWLYCECRTLEQKERVTEELRLFAKNNMIPVLKTMKYVVDTLRANNIVWGVGRGSSVASYVLHLIGVHKIDSVKYNLPIEEFFKGE